MLEFLLSNLKGKDRALRRFAILSVSQNHMSPVLFSAQALPGIIPEEKASENAKKPAEAKVVRSFGFWHVGHGFYASLDGLYIAITQNCNVAVFGFAPLPNCVTA